MTHANSSITSVQVLAESQPNLIVVLMQTGLTMVGNAYPIRE